MKTTRNAYEPWLRDCIRKRCPELEPAILAAIDAFDSIRRAKQVTPKTLAPIVEAASSSRRPLYEMATSFLGELTGQYPEARAEVETISKDSRSHVRFDAILCIGKSTPLSMTLQMLRQGLRDKSASVRAKAADWAVRRRLRELVPDLAEAATQETNAKANSDIEFALTMLRDGYILEPGPEDGYTVTTFSGNGIITRCVERTEFEGRGLQPIIAELAAQ